jgi:MFS family permease
VALTQKISQRNFLAFIWHASFFALSYSFMDIDTVMPAMLLRAGGSNFHIGLLTTILLGGNWFAQLFFAPFLYNRPRKKPYLIAGIGIRVIALFVFSLLFLYFQDIDNHWFITILLSLSLIFAISGSFAGVSYTDILGKSVLQEKRKKFFSIKQVIFSIGIFVSAIAVKKLLNLNEFPYNYFSLFLLASVFLLIASMGFLFIREFPVQVKKIKGFANYFNAFRNEFKTNPKLLYFLLTINTLGIGLGMLPFIISYIKQSYGLTGSEVGNLLIFKTLGLIISGVSLYFFSRKFKYKYILLTAFSISLGILILVLFFSSRYYIFPLIFLMGGMFYSLFSISKSGILLEISTNENRSLYAGLVGAGSILITLFPTLGGVIIDQFGFPFMFRVIIVILLSSLYFIHKLNCKA